MLLPKARRRIGEAVAEIVEYHGRVLHVEAATREGQRLHLKAAQAVRPGDVLPIAVDAERALVFRTAAAQTEQVRAEAEIAAAQAEAEAS